MAVTFRNINLHPANNLPSNLKETTYDVIVLGSGPVGRALAARTAARGLTTVIVEEELFGGDCPFWACIPSKALLRPGEALEAARQLGGAKELIRSDKIVDEKAVFARRDVFVQKWNDTFLVDLVHSQNVAIVRGKGALTDEKRVKVTNVADEVVDLAAKHAVVLATGSSPSILDIPGLKDVKPWTPREATASDHVPEHLVIVGAGVVGCEMATFYGSFQKKVTLISSSAGLLPKFEPEAGKRVLKALEDRGVAVQTLTTVQAFRKKGEGFEADLSDGTKVAGTTVLMATGRKANTDGIGLEQFGIQNQQKLDVDDSLCIKTSKGKWLFAIGDANGRSPLTHMGVYQARAAANTIISEAQGNGASEKRPWDEYSATADDSAIAQVVVTDPNVASAGLTLAEAKRRGFNVKEVAVPFLFPGAWVHAEFNYDGWAQWVIDVDREVLIGATFVGREAGGLLHASTVAIVGEVPVSRLWHAVASFPTLSEIYTALLNASGY